MLLHPMLSFIISLKTVTYNYDLCQWAIQLYTVGSSIGVTLFFRTYTSLWQPTGLFDPHRTSYDRMNIGGPVSHFSIMS